MPPHTFTRPSENLTLIKNMKKSPGQVASNRWKHFSSKVIFTVTVCLCFGLDTLCIIKKCCQPQGQWWYPRLHSGFLFYRKTNIIKIKIRKSLIMTVFIIFMQTCSWPYAYMKLWCSHNNKMATERVTRKCKAGQLAGCERTVHIWRRLAGWTYFAAICRTATDVLW